MLGSWKEWKLSVVWTVKKKISRLTKFLIDLYKDQSVWPGDFPKGSCNCKFDPSIDMIEGMHTKLGSWKEGKLSVVWTVKKKKADIQNF